MNHTTPNEKRQRPDDSDCKLKGLILVAKGLRLVLRITLVERIVSPWEPWIIRNHMPYHLCRLTFPPKCSHFEQTIATNKEQMW